MNKKAEGQGLGIMFFILLAITFSCVPTSHSKCMDECGEVFESEFTYVASCEKYNGTNSIQDLMTDDRSGYYEGECERTNYTKKGKSFALGYVRLRQKGDYG